MDTYDECPWCGKKIGDPEEVHEHCEVAYKRGTVSHNAVLSDALSENRQKVRNLIKTERALRQEIHALKGRLGVLISQMIDVLDPKKGED